jgi:hypothetical protein
MKKTIQWLILALVLIEIIVVIFWLVYPYKLIDFKNSPFPVLNENLTVKSGDRMSYLIDYCKYTDEMPRVIKYFVDGVVLEINTVDGVLEKGCHKTVLDVYIPRAIAASSYSVKIVATFKPNPIREIKYVTKTLNFTVVK